MKYDARNPGSTRSWSLFVAIAAAAMLLAGCAPSVKVRSDADPDVNLGKYQTYDFFSQLGVEGDSYSNLVGRHFRDAISVQMEARGYSQHLPGSVPLWRLLRSLWLWLHGKPLGVPLDDPHQRQPVHRGEYLYRHGRCQ